LIPYTRTIAYLSPSALVMLEERPVEFYFRRLGPVEFAPEREEQGFPAAVGISFDAFVKRAIADEDPKLRCPSQSFLLNDVRQRRDEAIAMGAQLLYGYKKCGAYKRLMEEKPFELNTDFEDFAPGTEVPVRTKLDAMTWYQSRPTIHDWKVKGANRPGQYSPTAGYCTIWDTDSPGIPGGPHKRFGEPLEALDSEWATQLTIYGWAAGFPVGRVMASIDEVVVGENHRVRVAQFRSEISEDFQKKVVERLKVAWQKIKEEKVLPEYMQEMTMDQLRILL
jgi:hypothetical protein